MDSAAAASPRPSQQQWLEGAYGQLLASVEEYALSNPEDSSLIPASPTVARFLRSMRLATSPDGAASLLKSVGWWAAHQHVSLMRVQAELQMPSQMQVSV